MARQRETNYLSSAGGTTGTAGSLKTPVPADGGRTKERATTAADASARRGERVSAPFVAPPSTPPADLPERLPTLERMLGKNGPLAQRLPGFAPRPQQLELAQAVATALKEGRPCLAEAGTGVGKTLGYLVPVLRHLHRNGGRAIISTHTLALQGQLVERDIPLLLAAVPEIDIQAAVLKGRSNFLCLQDLSVVSGELWTQGDERFKQIQRWSRESDSGDVAELDFAWPDWGEIAANADTCRQRECPFYDRCFYFKARKGAEDCGLLVVNHALFFADLRLRRANPGMPSLIPDYDIVVFDEAHHVEDMATRAFGLEWGSRRVPQLIARVRRLQEEIDPARLAAIESYNQLVLTPFLQGDATEAFLDERIRGEEMEQQFAEHTDALCNSLDALTKDLVKLSDTAEDTTDRDRTAGLARTSSRLSTELRQVIRAECVDDDAPHFRWFQTRRTNRGYAFTTLTRTPLAVDQTMQKVLLDRCPRIIFTSATLASGGNFKYLKERLGLNGANVPAPVEAMIGSPFDYPKNCLFYVPRGMGGTGGAASIERLMEEIHALIALAQGRTFVLFTSHRVLKMVEERLAGQLPYPLFVQGEMPNARLVQEFAKAGNGVLLGTSSFWEGVDVPGPALSCVIMDKLPFAMPDAPMQRARENDIKERGGDSFRDLSLPQAQLRLKQGFGRLLRSVFDRGVVAVLDERIWTKGYSKGFLADLPGCPHTDNRDAVAKFFAHEAKQNKPNGIISAGGGTV